jgi:hypothetical protein
MKLSNSEIGIRTVLMVRDNLVSSSLTREHFLRDDSVDGFHKSEGVIRESDIESILDK